MQPLHYIRIFFILFLILNIFILVNAQERTTNTDSTLWHIDIGNYLNHEEANNELKRLNSMGFDGKIVDVTENNTNFHQLRIGCYLNKATALAHMTLVRPHLRYPNLSKIGQSSESTAISTSSSLICLGYEIGFTLPKNWQIIQHAKVFLLSVSLLDYENLMAFNGTQWQSFKSIEEISEKWSESELESFTDTSEFRCQQGTGKANILCNFGEKSIATAVFGDILWQNVHTAIYKNDNLLGVIKLRYFE